MMRGLMMHGNDHNNDSEDELHGYDEPSRSQLRREALDVLKLAHALVAMSDAQLTRVPLEDELREEVARARGVTQQIARKRQTQYLAKQLRKLEDDQLEAIRATLDNDRDRAHRDAASLHRVESWRDRLIAEGDDALTEFLQQFPQSDRQHLRQLARQARAERDASKPPHAQRELFRALRELVLD
jgi:ribosome-associated protein